MLYEMKQKNDIKSIMKYGKAYGAFLLHCLLHKICDINNFFIFDSIEDFEKIENKLPEKFVLRADAKTGDKPTLGVRGALVSKSEVQKYIDNVKEHNPEGVVLCMDTATERKGKSMDGAFNVYFEWGDKVYIDYLGQGFDVGGITKGEDNHEMWAIDWENLLFVKPKTMNLYRTYLISDEEYKKSVERKREFTMKQNNLTQEQVKVIIPDKYKPMPLSIKEKLLDDIILEIYSKKEELPKLGLKSFGVQGMIRDGELFPIEINRRERFIEKEDKSDEKNRINER